MWVTPSEECDKNNKVCIWDSDPAHAEFGWKNDEGDFHSILISGDKKHPGKGYQVADTDFVRERIKFGFLKEVPAPTSKQLKEQG